MPDLRQNLIDAGWRQGVILEPDGFGADDACGMLVLNQTCDCINPDFEKEPYLELLPLERIADGPDPALMNGRNPREIHFQVLERGSELWVRAKVSRIHQHERRNLDQLRFAPELTVSPGTLDDLIQWRAERYSRAAFPDAFERAFGKFSKKFGRIVSRHENDIDSLLVALSPWGEVVEDEPYEIWIRLMVTPEVFGQPGRVKPLQEACSRIEELFAASPWFECLECAVVSLAKMSLWDKRRFMDFTRYDYLSFGQEDPAPDSPSSS